MNAGSIWVHIKANIAHLERNIGNAQRGIAGMAKRITKSLRSIPWKSIALGITAVIGGATYAFSKLTKSIIKAGSTSEGFRTRLNALLGSTQEGSRLFKEMADYAGKVPFEFEQVMAGATQLAGVMKGGVDEIVQWMPMIGDLAAVTGMTLQETIGQVIRMYSAGAASADMFRERGILAMMGFKAKTHYTAEETRTMMMESWNKMGSQFKGVTEELAKTWEGKMSMLKDAWFAFKNAVADAGVFEYLKEKFQELLDFIKQLEESGKLQEWAGKISVAIENVISWFIMWIQWFYENWPNIKLWISWYADWINYYVIESMIEMAKSFIFVVEEIKNAKTAIKLWVQENENGINKVLDLLGNIVLAFEWVYKKAVWFIKGVIKVYGTLVSYTTKPLQWIIEILGKASSAMPLTEKMSQLKGEISNFTSYISNQRPSYHVDISSAMASLSQVARKASQVSSAVSGASGGGTMGGSTNYGLWTGEGGSVTLGPDESLGYDQFHNIVIQHNPKPASALAGDAERQKNIINVNMNNNMMTGDKSAGREAAYEIQKELDMLNQRVN